MMGRELCPIPFLQHQRGDAFKLGVLIRRADIAGQFQPMAVGIEEIDGAENTVIGRPQHIDAILSKTALRVPLDGLPTPRFSFAI